MQFQQLTPAARSYILGVYVSASVFVVVAWWLSLGSAVTLTFVILAVAATLAHCFPVSVPGRQAYHVSLPFLVAAIFLLTPLQVTALLLIVHAVEWLRRRRSWFVQSFSVASYVISAATAQTLYFALWPTHTRPSNLDDPRSLVAGLLAIATFALLNRGLNSVAIWLGNRIPPREQQMFSFESLLVDVVLLAMGLPLAHFWVTAPVAVVLCVAPLLLIHRALDLPNTSAQAGKDALTQLYSFEYLKEICARELIRAQRFGRPIALLMLDVDDLGAINDDFGYQTGDAIIQGVALTLQRALREYDVAARVMGGQFAILLPEMDLAGAQEFAEALQGVIGERRFDVATSVHAISTSVGFGGVVAENGAHSSEYLVAAAEAALRVAKRAGSNQSHVVTIAAQPDALPVSQDQSLTSTPAEANEWTAGDPPVLLRVSSPNGAELLGDGFRWTRRLDSWFIEYPRTAMLLVISIVAAVVVGSIYLAEPAIADLNLLTVLWLIALVALAETRDFQLSERTAYSISVVPIIAAGMLLGAPGGIVVAPVAALVRGIRRRNRWYNVAFNAGTYVIAAAAAAEVFDLLGFGQVLAPNNLVTLLPAAAFAGVAFYFHTFIVAAFMATDIRIGPTQAWSEHFRWLWPHHIVLSVMGLLLVLAYSEFGILGAAAFVVPPIMMRYVAKQYIDHTVESVRQLRALNQQLADEIAQRTAVEEENARLAHEVARVAALEELSRLKSEFISIASHELRTPMTSILGFSELLLARTDPDVPHRFMMTVIHDEAVHLSGLVDNLLDSSRIETGRMSVELEPTDLGETMMALLRTLTGTTSRHVLIHDVAPNARFVMADPSRLQQILTNLLGNAIKYSPDGGRIMICARVVPRSEFVSVSVSDQGIGIPPEYLERIFDRFQRVDSSETRTIRGTGLGLYIVRHLVELHGGTIQVESDVGRGSTFSFTLRSAMANRTDGVAPSALVGTLR